MFRVKEEQHTSVETSALTPSAASRFQPPTLLIPQPPPLVPVGSVRPKMDLPKICDTKPLSSEYVHGELVKNSDEQEPSDMDKHGSLLAFSNVPPKHAEIPKLVDSSVARSLDSLERGSGTENMHIKVESGTCRPQACAPVPTVANITTHGMSSAFSPPHVFDTRSLFMGNAQSLVTSDKERTEAASAADENASLSTAEGPRSSQALQVPEKACSSNPVKIKEEVIDPYEYEDEEEEKVELRRTPSPEATPDKTELCRTKSAM